MMRENRLNFKYAIHSTSPFYIAPCLESENILKLVFFFFSIFLLFFSVFFYQFTDESHIKPLISSIYFMCFFVYILAQTQGGSEQESERK